MKNHLVVMPVSLENLIYYPSKLSIHIATKPLELVHTDLYGPFESESYSGDKYFILFVDDYSRMMTVMYLKDKLVAF